MANALCKVSPRIWLIFLLILISIILLLQLDFELVWTNSTTVKWKKFGIDMLKKTNLNWDGMHKTKTRPPRPLMSWGANETEQDNDTRPYFVMSYDAGMGLGNQMFVYASAYGRSWRVHDATGLVSSRTRCPRANPDFYLPPGVGQTSHVHAHRVLRTEITDALHTLPDLRITS
jgi:hypothetical protein